MKKFTKVIALILSLTLLLCFPIGVSAAEPEDTGVDTAAKGSLTIYQRRERRRVGFQLRVYRRLRPDRE